MIPIVCTLSFAWCSCWSRSSAYSHHGMSHENQCPCTGRSIHYHPLNGKIKLQSRAARRSKEERRWPRPWSSAGWTIALGQLISYTSSLQYLPGTTRYRCSTQKPMRFGAEAGWRCSSVHAEQYESRCFFVCFFFLLIASFCSIAVPGNGVDTRSTISAMNHGWLSSHHRGYKLRIRIPYCRM